MKTIFLIHLMILVFSYVTVTAQNLGWAKKIGGNGDDRGKAIAMDKSGNIYTTGSFTGTADFDPGVGIFNLTSQGGKDIFISKLDINGNFVWAKSMGGVSDEVCYSIAIDSLGNVYTTGFFNNLADFDPNAAVFNLIPNYAQGIFISKLDSMGNFVWAKAIDTKTTSANQYSHPYMTIDVSANVYISNAFIDTIDFDPGAGVFNLGGSPQNVFILKLDYLGNFVWVKKFGGAECYGLAVDGAGNICSTGEFYGTKDFDPNGGIFNLSAQGQGNFYILKLDSLGNFIWAKSIDGEYGTFPNTMNIDSANNIFIVGSFYDSLDFDPGVGVFNLTAQSPFSKDIFILKLNVNGHFAWAKNIGGQGNDSGYGIALDVVGNVYTTGYFVGTADFDPNAGVFNLTNPTGGTFISKLNNAGNFVWAKTTQGTGLNEAYGLVVDSNDNVYTIGVFSTAVDFDPNAGIYNLTATGSSADIFIHKMSQPLTPITKTETPLPITLYPNPSNGILQLEIAQDFRTATIEIINTLGQVLVRTQTSDRNSQLVLPDEVGVYFVRVDVEGVVGIYKIVRE